MVKFEGTLSDKCVLYRTKCVNRVGIIAASILVVVNVLVGLLFISFGFKLSEVRGLFISTAALACVILFLIPYLVKNKKPRVKLCISLSADSAFIEYTANAVKAEKIPTNSIKKVIKIDQSYYILRKHGGMAFSVMAEESLLKEGTIEEFEALFAGKIERKDAKESK